MVRPTITQMKLLSFSYAVYIQAFQYVPIDVWFLTSPGVSQHNWFPDVNVFNSIKAVKKSQDLQKCWPVIDSLIIEVYMSLYKRVCEHT